jgi:hypothetical protein
MSAVVTTVKPRCIACAAFLARDNRGPRCSPCERTYQSTRYGADRVNVRAASASEAAAAFRDNGLPGIADAFGCSIGAALQVALAYGIVSPLYRRRANLVVRLVALSGHSHIAAGEQLGLSRWTVATYRRDLGLSSTES